MSDEPCYGISADRLMEYYRSLRKLGFGEVSSAPSTKATLFLTGVRYAFSFVQASRAGQNPLVPFAPRCDSTDGVEPVARCVLRRLVRIARGRKMSRLWEGVPGGAAPNEEGFRLAMAWHQVEELTARTVEEWLQAGDPEERWVRLCLAVGIVSPWDKDSLDLVFGMARKPLVVLTPEGTTVGQEVVIELIRSFAQRKPQDLRLA